MNEYTVFQGDQAAARQVVQTHFFKRELKCLLKRKTFQYIFGGAIFSPRKHTVEIILLTALSAQSVYEFLETIRVILFILLVSQSTVYYRKTFRYAITDL